MEILGIIGMVTGIILSLVGRKVARQLPPNYQSEDDGFIQLLQMTGGLISGAGVLIFVVGVICLVIGYMLR